MSDGATTVPAGTQRTRVATIDDMADVVASVHRLFQVDAGANDPLVDVGWPERAGLGHYTRLLADPACGIFVASPDGRVVGHLVGKLSPPTATRPAQVTVLESLYVDPDHRGQGLGSELVQRFLTWSSEHHAARAVVTAYVGNAAAMQLYARSRFRPQSTVLTLDL